MDVQKLKVKRGIRRKHRVRRLIRGSATIPRLSVHRSNMHIYAQLIDDDKQVTIAAASSNDKDSGTEYGGNIAAAVLVGKKLAEIAKSKGVTVAAFDRGPFRFHGRLKALARAATEAGLVCTGLVDKPKKVKAAPEPTKAKAAKPKKGK